MSQRTEGPRSSLHRTLTAKNGVCKRISLSNQKSGHMFWEWHLTYVIWLGMTSDCCGDRGHMTMHFVQKVKLSLCFNWVPRHEDVLGEWKYSSTPSLTALDGGEWSVSRPGRFTPREGGLGTHWTRGWVGLRAGLDTVVKRIFSSPCRDSNSRSSSAISLSYPGCIRNLSYAGSRLGQSHGNAFHVNVYVNSKGISKHQGVLMATELSTPHLGSDMAHTSFLADVRYTMVPSSSHTHKWVPLPRAWRVLVLRMEETASRCGG
jgi:hypothetical protein